MLSEPRERSGRHARCVRPSVNSALKRARVGLQRRRRPAADREPPPAPASKAEEAIVAKFVSAWESADLDALVALLTDDVFVSMPPMPFEYEGSDVVTRFCAALFGAGRRFDLVATRANGQPAFGAYLRGPAGISHGVGLYVLTLSGDGICAMTRFDNSVLPSWSIRSATARLACAITRLRNGTAPSNSWSESVT
ncbi:MAG: nuclear transport factor 2 family protein [Mycobacterium sp.]